MKHSLIHKMSSMLLAMIMCGSICGSIVTNAQDIETETPKQVEQTENDDQEGLSGTDLIESQTDENEILNPGTQETPAPEEQEVSSITEQTESENSDTIEPAPEEDSESTEQLFQEEELQAMATGLKAPRVEGGMIVWDCIEFGRYPQAEVIPTKEGYDRLSQVEWSDSDIIVDSQLYDKLKDSNNEWDENLDKTIDGVKYRVVTESSMFQGTGGFYKWPIQTGSVHLYFKYEPVKWRILEIKGNQALLLADKALDEWPYSTSKSATWETSAARSGTRTFTERAFTSNELNAIIETSLENKPNISYGTSGGNTTKDKVFLLSEEDVYGSKAALHGFSTSPDTYDAARYCKSSTYAKAKRLHSDTREGSAGNCNWWLRSPGRDSNSAAYVFVLGNGNSSGSFVDSRNLGLRPAMWIDLSTAKYTPAGTAKAPVSSASATDPVIPSKIKVTGITLSGISNKIAAGKKVRLTAGVRPSNASDPRVIWKSSNTKIATVNQSGVVTMNKKSGGRSVTITATAVDGSGVYANYKLISMKDSVKKVTISGKKSVKAGKTLKLKAKVTASKKANKKLKWTTSNSKYATVSSSGKVKTFKAGRGKKVKITASATDGSGKKKSITISIKK